MNLSISQITRRWRCSRGHVQALIAKGLLNAFNISPAAKRPTWRIPLASLVAFENRQQVTAGG